MITELIIAFCTGVIACVCTRRWVPHLPIDAVLARGALGMIFTTFAFIHLDGGHSFNHEPIALILAPIYGLLALAALVTLPSLFYRLFGRVSRLANVQINRARQMHEEYVFHRYRDRE